MHLVAHGHAIAQRSLAQGARVAALEEALAAAEVQVAEARDAAEAEREAAVADAARRAEARGRAVAEAKAEQRAEAAAAKAAVEAAEAAELRAERAAVAAVESWCVGRPCARACCAVWRVRPDVTQLSQSIRGAREQRAAI